MKSDNGKKIKIGISGYRGIWGVDFNEQIAYKLALSFALLIKKEGGKRIAVGRDARQSGNRILEAIHQAFNESGIEMVDLGIIPTPSVLLIVRKEKIDGGMIITASHNPKEYNGIKFVLSTGSLAGQETLNQIEQIFDTLGTDKNPSISMPTAQMDNSKYREIHINEILKNIDIESITKRKFRIVLDPVNSAGSIISQELLKKLGCEVVVINGEPDGNFSRNPEPTIENCREIGRIVKDKNADMGFSQDPDADRLLLTDETGETLSEEYSLALAVRNVFHKEKMDVVINMSTSNMIADIAKEQGVKVYRTKVGELNVVNKIIEVGGFGGEGNGGIVYPKINLTRDSLIGIAFILELLAKENKKLSEVVSTFPKYFMRKEKLNMEIAKGMYENIKNIFPESVEDRQDGIRLDLPDSSWIHIRSSNTEPVTRIIGEAKSEERLKEILDKALKPLNN